MQLGFYYLESYYYMYSNNNNNRRRYLDYASIKEIKYLILTISKFDLMRWRE